MLLDLVYYAVKHLGFTARVANLAFSHYTTHGSFADSSSGNGVNFSLISNALSLPVFYALGKQNNDLNLFKPKAESLKAKAALVFSFWLTT